MSFNWCPGPSLDFIFTHSYTIKPVLGIKPCNRLQYRLFERGLVERVYNSLQEQQLLASLPFPPPAADYLHFSAQVELPCSEAAACQDTHYRSFVGQSVCVRVYEEKGEGGGGGGWACACLGKADQKFSNISGFQVFTLYMPLTLMYHKS